MPPVTIGRGNLYFRGLNLGVVTPKEVMEAPYTATAKIDGDIYEHFVNTVLFDMRVHFIVGYNPQKLLPAPSFEREMMQTVLEWAQSQKLDPYMEFSQSVFNTLSRDGEVTYSPTGRYIAEPEAFSAAHYLAARVDEDIARMRDSGPIDPVVFVGGDFTKLEISYLSATLLAESAGGMPTPRGRIEIFDYEDGTIMKLEGAGELHGYEDVLSKIAKSVGISYDQLTAPFDAKPAVQPIRRQPSYLDHDPTKKHRRRRRGK